MKFHSMTILCFVFLGCNKGRPTESEISQTAPDTRTSLLLESADKLPECTPSREGVLAYLMEEQEFRACSQTKWMKVNIEGPKGKDGYSTVISKKEIHGELCTTHGYVIEFFSDRDGNGGVSSGDEMLKDSGIVVCDGEQGEQGMQGDQGESGTCSLEPVTGGVKVHCGENEYVLANPGTTIVTNPVTATAQTGASPDVSTIPSGDIYWEDANGQVVNVLGQPGPSVLVGATQYYIPWSAERGFYFPPLSAFFVSDDCSGIPLTEFYGGHSIYEADSKHFIADTNVSFENLVLTKSSVWYEAGFAHCQKEDRIWWGPNLRPLVEITLPETLGIEHFVPPFVMKQMP